MAEKIGQILIRKGKITAAQLRDALRTQQFFGGYLGSHLINLGVIDEASLGETLSEIYRVPFATYESIRLAKPDAIASIPADLAQRYRVIPLHLDGERIHLAMLNPRDAAAIKEVSAVTGLIVAPWVSPEFRIVHALDRHYRIRRERRGSIALNSTDPSQQSPRPSDEPRPGAWHDPRDPNIGLDGLPIDAVAIPALGATLVGPRQMGPIPRSLEEWRDSDHETAQDATPPPPSHGAGRTPVITADMRVEEAHAPGSGGIAGATDSSSAEEWGTAPTGTREAPSEHSAHSKAHIFQGMQEIDRLAESLSGVSSRDGLARAIVAFLGERFKRTASFTVRDDQIEGWRAGEGFPADRLSRFAIPVSEPSIFRTALRSLDVHLGAVPAEPGALGFYALLGLTPPPAMLMIPVVMRDRVVAFLYADNDMGSLGPIDLSIWRRLGYVAAMSLEILIIKNKMRRT